MVKNTFWCLSDFTAVLKLEVFCASVDKPGIILSAYWFYFTMLCE